MLPLLIRLAVIALIIYVFYKAIRYITDPKRKLDEAYEKGQYYFYDDVKNVRKNFFISYKGALFEGEKYLGTTEDSFEVVTILLVPVTPLNCKVLRKETLNTFSKKSY